MGHGEFADPVQQRRLESPQGARHPAHASKLSYRPHADQHGGPKVKQAVQSYRTGKLELADVPAPGVEPGSSSFSRGRRSFRSAPSEWSWTWPRSRSSARPARGPTWSGR